MVYEYSVMVETGLIDPQGVAAASPDAVSRAQGDGVNSLVQKVMRNAADLAGGGWEIHSIDQLVVADKLITTFLLRRERGQDAP